MTQIMKWTMRKLPCPIRVLASKLAPIQFKSIIDMHVPPMIDVSLKAEAAGGSMIYTKKGALEVPVEESELTMNTKQTADRL